MGRKYVIITTIVALISAIGFFVSGYFTYPLLLTERVEDKKTTKIITDSENESTLFKSGKHYFDDTILVIAKNEPHYTLVATANRTEKDSSNYLQNTRVSYFNGVEWRRFIRSDTNSNSAIKNNEFITNWTVDIDKSKVLKQSARGQLNLDKIQINFDTQTLENEISVRSLPGYTKFMSESDGILTIDGHQFEAYVLYTRVYSSNSSDLFTYDGNIGILTDWVAFWDKNGDFYHIDSTDVSNPVPNYQTHSIGIIKDKKGNVLKTFKVNVTRDSFKPPVNYEINLGIPVNINLNFNRINSINKAPNNSYIWHMGNIKNDNGIGLVEYIFK